jgi:hypothetical protein
MLEMSRLADFRAMVTPVRRSRLVVAQSGA